MAETSRNQALAVDSRVVAETAEKISRGWSRYKWFGAAIGVFVAAVDTATIKMLGTSFSLHGRDVTLLVGGWFGSSFAILGFLLGDAIAGRRRHRRAAEVIRDQMEAINRSRERLVQSEKLAALGQLAAAIAHEVRNPLAVIRSAAQNVAERLDHGQIEERRACTFVTEETDRLSHLVTALLAFARPVEIQPHAISIAECIERAAMLNGDRLASKRITLRRSTAQALPQVRADSELISQVIAGLVENAIEAVPPGGEIVLDTVALTDCVQVAVADSGPGVPPELRERVFEPFFTTRAKGVGLGLAIARQIVEAHGGRIELGSSDSGGARFVVSVPTASRQAAAA
jgi:signal transduction histidine kinase